MSNPLPPIIDPQALENLRALGDDGDDSFVKEIIGIYREDLPVRIAALKTARATDDRPLYTRSAHTIKGSSANVGAAQVQSLAALLEQRSKEEPLAALDAEFQQLELACERALAALQAEIAK